MINNFMGNFFYSFFFYLFYFFIDFMSFIYLAHLNYKYHFVPYKRKLTTFNMILLHTKVNFIGCLQLFYTIFGRIYKHDTFFFFFSPRNLKLILPIPVYSILHLCNLSPHFYYVVNYFILFYTQQAIRMTKYLNRTAAD